MPDPRTKAPIVLLTAILLLGGAWGSHPDAAAAEGGDPASVFTCFEKGWRGESAAGVARCIEAAGSARFDLATYPLSGRAHTLKPAQARASLTTYFRKISGVRLTDVTPAKGPTNVRLYDYTYKPAGKNVRTTHLQVRLRRNEKRRWVLASVTESV